MNKAKEETLSDFKLKIAESRQRYIIETMEYRRRLLEQTAEELRKKQRAR